MVGEHIIGGAHLLKSGKQTLFQRRGVIYRERGILVLDETVRRGMTVLFFYKEAVSCKLKDVG